MSATVTISIVLDITVTVAKADAYEIDADTGYLHLKTSNWCGERVAVFKEWHHVVIEPNRGPNGRFVKKSS